MAVRTLCFLLTFLGMGLAQGQELTQQRNYTRADSLRGGVRMERTHFDVLKYDLWVEVNPEEKFISGVNHIDFKVLQDLPVMQLDLFENMKIDSIVLEGETLDYKREYNAVFIHFDRALRKGETKQVSFYYSGHPIIAKKPPWDGGFIFTKDKNGKDWISVAVQGTGASLWYPNKDTQADEPEEAEIHVTVPEGLMNVSNGRLTGKEILDDGRIQWSWKVSNPINNYNLVLNIGDYVHFSDTYKDVDLDFYVLPYHLEKAKEHFKEARKMMACFSEKFGDYPFKEDGYKLIETPYLGMEHQSAIGYGNGFQKGYAGRDRSGTGVGLKWDFIIIHESGHEWFGNSITSADIADMWIHEAFTTYAEAVYVECEWGKKEALTYLLGTRKTVVSHDRPIIGDYGVNQTGSGDMYSKGANMLHTLRAVLNDDQKWWALLKNFHETFKHQITDTQAVTNFFNAHFEVDLLPIFDQYLRTINLPELQLKIENDTVFYRWEAQTRNFAMPVDVFISGKKVRLYPTQSWKSLDRPLSVDQLKPDTDNFYCEVKKL